MTDIKTVLVVEDDRLIREMLRETLEAEKFLVIEASKGQRAVEILSCHKADIILLDLGLPDAVDLEFIPAIRALTSAPIIVVSGEEDHEKKVDCLKAGADDFIAKPVDFAMLIAKSHAHIRRFQAAFPVIGVQTETSVIKPAQLRFGPWCVDQDQYQLFDQAGASAELTIKEFKILMLLIKDAGKTLKRPDLCAAIKEQNYVPSDRAIDVKIARIRKKIRDDLAAPKLIQTIRGAGYLFNKEEIKHDA